MALFALLLVSCEKSEPPAAQGPAPAAQKPQETAQANLDILYPYDGALFPPEIVAPVFRWQVAGGAPSGYRIALQFQDGGAAIDATVTTTTWTPDDGQWEEIKKRSVDAPSTVTVQALGGGSTPRPLAQAEIAIQTSHDQVGASIFFREVNLPFEEAAKDPSRIRWRYGSIASKEQPRIVLEKLPVCGNCHSFSRDGKTLAMEVDSGNDKGAYAVLPIEREMVLDKEKIITWTDYHREDGNPTFGLLCQISPDGRYVAGTVKDQALAVYRDDLMFSQLFFLIKGIVAVYDRQEKTIEALPGADDTECVQTNATWSPDGQSLAFSRAKAYDDPEIRRQRTALVGGELAEKFLQTDGKNYPYEISTRSRSTMAKGAKPCRSRAPRAMA